MEQARNLKPFLRKLNPAQRAVLARIISQREQWADYHIGMLPFMHYGNVMEWLRAWNNKFGTRFTKKIEVDLALDLPAGFMATLDDSKVYRRFGKHPERGVMIPGLPTYYRARERRPFERNEKGVHHKGGNVWGHVTQKEAVFDIKNVTVSLKRVGANRWLVNCREGTLKYVVNWLKENVA